MLSNNNQTSSIQKRRQLHRRQNSLEVPVLVAPPSASRRRPQAHHRRGLSLDQSMVGGSFAQMQGAELPMVSIATNTGRPQSQHSMQAQLQYTPQPGFQMETHQPQINTFTHNNNNNNNPQFQPQLPQNHPMAHYAPREQALEDLNRHIATFMQRFGPVTESNMIQQPQPQMVQYSQAYSPSEVSAQRPVTPSNSFTPMPSCPLSEPPRRMDVAPMPNAFANVPMLHIQSPMGSGTTPDLLQESFGSDYGYASSYASSLADPSSPIHSSPARQNSVTGMPTLYEDMSPASSHGPFGQEHILLAAAEGSPCDLRYMTESPMRPPMSPREMMLATLEIDASIEDTGISMEEVQQYISEQDENTNKWTCLYEGCFKTFARKENIKSHVQTHLGDRQFKCNHCGKCFVRQHDLKRHAKIHSGDKPHKCPCGNGFARQDALTRHRQRGVCEGALPGFERREVKRGRPRKARPDMADRMDKANKTRTSARRGSEAISAYGSSSPSDRSYPSTPQDADLEEDPFVDYDRTGNAQFTSFVKQSQYEATPPTSPNSRHASSPEKVDCKISATEMWFVETQQSTTQRSSPRSSPPPVDNSSPVLDTQSSSDAFANSLFDYSTLDAQTKVCEPTSIFSPAESSSNGSDYEYQSPEANTGAETFMGAEAILDFSNYGPGEALFQTSLADWQ